MFFYFINPLFWPLFESYFFTYQLFAETILNGTIYCELIQESIHINTISG